MSPTSTLRFYCVISFILYLSINSAQGTPQTAFIERHHVKQAITLAQTLDTRKQRNPPTGSSWFKIIEGDIPIIITAPHATKAMRNGKLRFSDGGGTAALAHLLNALTGVTVMYSTYASPSDPNYYNDNAFKAKLKQLIIDKQPRLVLDIHASHAFRPYDIDFGTLHGRSIKGQDTLIPTLIEHLKIQGIDNFSANYFAASSQDTITKWAYQLGVPSIQLEINKTWLTPDKGALYAQRFAQMLQGLADFIRHH